MGQKSRAKRQRQVQAKGRAPGRRSSVQHFLWPVLALVLVVAIAGAAVAGKGLLSSPSPSTASTGSPATSMPSDSSTSSDGAVLGRPIAGRSVAFASTQGTAVSLQRYRGKTLVVYFYEGFT
jgi:hypothetical protein